jgi:hypothetical protein
MEATFENETFGKEKLELFVFVFVFVVFETEKYERCEFQYEAGKKVGIMKSHIAKIEEETNRVPILRYETNCWRMTSSRTKVKP